MGESQRSGALPQHDESLRRVIIGRPVWFVDGDKVRDRKAEASLETAAHAAGFAEVAFQLEPIAAALDYESMIDEEQTALIADIGGGMTPGPRTRRTRGAGENPGRPPRKRTHLAR